MQSVGGNRKQIKMILQPSRRSLIVGMASLLAAPAIVRVSSLMPVKVIDNDLSAMKILLDYRYHKFATEYLKMMKAVEDDMFAVTGFPLEYQ